MSIENVRFRTEGALVVLQVCERKLYSNYDREPTWRDAKVEDLLEVAGFFCPHGNMVNEFREVS